MSITALASILVYAASSPCVLEGYSHEWPGHISAAVAAGPDAEWANCRPNSGLSVEFSSKAELAGRRGITAGFGGFDAFKVEVYDAFGAVIAHSRAGRLEDAAEILREIVRGSSAIAVNGPEALDRAWGLHMLKHASAGLLSVEVALAGGGVAR